MENEADFYLTAAGESEKLAVPRACWVKGRLKDHVRDDHMLIRIEPPLVGQGFGLGDKDIFDLIISTRFGEEKGTGYFSGDFRGRPRWRRVDSRPKVVAITACSLLSRRVAGGSRRCGAW